LILIAFALATFVAAVLHVRLVRVATQRGAIAPLDPTRRKESTGWHLLLTRYKDPAVESARRLTLIALAVALAVLLSIFLSAQISPLEAPPAFFSGVALLVGGFWLWTAWRWWLTRRPSSRIAAALLAAGLSVLLAWTLQGALRTWM